MQKDGTDVNRVNEETCSHFYLSLRSEASNLFAVLFAGTSGLSKLIKERRMRHGWKTREIG